MFLMNFKILEVFSKLLAIKYPKKKYPNYFHSITFLIQSLMMSHDAVAQKDFYPHLPEIPVEVDEDEETIKIVQLVKSNEPLVS